MDDNDLPTVTLLIAAYNEESDIRARLENALLSTYPKHKYDVVVASDGSTDRTNQIVTSIQIHPCRGGAVHR